MYLVVATSARAIAQGLKLNQLDVVTIDGFADQDNCAATVECICVSRTKFGLIPAEIKQSLEIILRKYSFTGLMYDAAVECNPSLLNIIKDIPVIGNSLSTLQSLSKPYKLFSVFESHKIIYPETAFNKTESMDKSWLCKVPLTSGGLGVLSIDSSEVFSDNVYFQKKVNGQSGSITFLANRNDVKVLGINQTWVEQHGPNLHYVYSGVLNHIVLNQNQKIKLIEYTKIIIREFQLLGLCGIDFIADEKDVYILEVNPRIPASYELYETKSGSLMDEHIQVCTSESFSDNTYSPHLRGQLVVYAPFDLTIPENIAWPLWTADRPCNGTVIKQFEPVCTVFSGGKNNAALKSMLKTRKQAILKKLKV